MAGLGLEDNPKMLGDVLAWSLNVSSSVAIVFVNKILMDPLRGFGFVYATTLCCFHFFVSGLAVKASEALGYSTFAKLPFRGAF